MIYASNQHNICIHYLVEKCIYAHVLLYAC